MPRRSSAATRAKLSIGSPSTRSTMCCPTPLPAAASSLTAHRNPAAATPIWATGRRSSRLCTTSSWQALWQRKSCTRSTRMPRWATCSAVWRTTPSPRSPRISCRSCSRITSTGFSPMCRPPVSIPTICSASLMRTTSTSRWARMIRRSSKRVRWTSLPSATT